MRFLLLLEWIASLLLFLLSVKQETLLSICVLIFSFIYLLGLLESKNDPQRIRAHIMVGGVLFFITAVMTLLNDLSKLNLQFNLPRNLLIFLGLIGLIQANVVRKSFK
ncbi:hypothetical protein [Pseudothermotoga sp.]|uniref:hypothetical protein n=1 Tax=Pseudothermotoga sp. TaxID=2033661 RepID=UPI0031F63125